MRLSIGRVSQGGDAHSGTAHWGDIEGEVYGHAWRRMALWLAVILVLGSAGLLFTPKRAGAATVFGSGQVFVSVGNSQVNIYDPVSGSYLTTLTDNSGGNDYTVGSAFDSQGNFYVTDDDGSQDSLSQISEFLPNETQKATFGNLITPTSIVFDANRDMYVGQQLSPNIAEFAPTPGTAANPTTGAPADWTRMPDITVQLHDLSPGVDHIELDHTGCIIYYTSEGAAIHTYDKCHATQGPDFNQVPFTQPVSTTVNSAYGLRILPGVGDVLVADSGNVLELGPSGNVIQTYPCSSMPGCGNSLFAMSIDPSGTSFWTADSSSGNIYQVNIATGAVMQTISTGGLGGVFGLSVGNQLEVGAGPGNPPLPFPPTLTVIPPTTPVVSGTSTQVSAELTNSTGQPLTGESVTLTLGGDSCQGVVNSLGIASCYITPGGTAGSYTLTASFDDTSASTAIPQATSTLQIPITVGLEPTTLTYTGPTGTMVNGQTIIPSATLTTNPASGPPVPVVGQPVTFTIGAQTCSGTTDVNGVVDCTSNPITLKQPTTAVSIVTSYNPPPNYYSGTNTTTHITVTQPTILTMQNPPASGDYSDSTPVSATLTDSNNVPIANQPVTFTLNGTETCAPAMTNSAGVATCNITPGEKAASYPLTATFAGYYPPDPTTALQLLSTSETSTFNVTLEETAISYTGPTSVFNGQNLTVTGVLVEQPDGTPIAGRTVSFVLGSGSTAQPCTTNPTTDSTGTASCTIPNVNQTTVAPVPLFVMFTSDGYYRTATVTPNINVGPQQVGTTLTVPTVTQDYNDATTVSATLIDTYTNAGAANEPVTITLTSPYGTQSCTGTTLASGVASCPMTPNEPAGTYTLSAAFTGDTTPWPHLGASTGSGLFVVTHEEAALKYTGTTSATSGSSATLSGVLTTDDPALGTPIAGRTVTFTLGSGTSAQSCSGVTLPSGAASCQILKVNQTTSPVPVTANFAGNAWYIPAKATGSVTISTPTTLSVSATTGTYGQPTTISGTLTNSVTGAPISGQTVTLTLNGAQTCTAVTNAMGIASCPITPTEASGTYTVSGTFGGGTSSTTLLPSSGHNCFVVTTALTIVTFTGQTSVSSGQTLTLSSTLTTSSGTPIVGQTVVETLGTGHSAQSCTAVTNSLGVASCTIQVNQVYGSALVSVSYGGNTYYHSSASSTSEKIGCGGGGGGGSGGGGLGCA